MNLWFAVIIALLFGVIVGYALAQEMPAREKRKRETPVDPVWRNLIETTADNTILNGHARDALRYVAYPTTPIGYYPPMYLDDITPFTVEDYERLLKLYNAKPRANHIWKDTRGTGGNFIPAQGSDGIRWQLHDPLEECPDCANPYQRHIEQVDPEARKRLMLGDWLVPDEDCKSSYPSSDRTFDGSPLRYPSPQADTGDEDPPPDEA